MANTKVFSIKINGLEESAKAAQTLAEKLEELSKQGKSLKDIRVDVSAKSEKDVDNLVDSIEDLQYVIDDVRGMKLEFKIGDAIYEFDSLKQAAKELGKELQLLYTRGEQNTETYRQLAEAYEQVRASISATTTELERIASPSAQLVDTISVLQGFTAVATVGTGIKNLFGIDNDAIDESIKKMTSLIGVLEGINKIQEAMEKQTAFGKLIESWNKPLDRFFSTFSKNKGTVSNVNAELRDTQAAGVQAQQGLVAVGDGAKSAAVGINVMKTAARTFWLFALIEAITLAIEWLGKGVKALYNWATGADKAKAQTELVTRTMSRLKEETEAFNRVVDKAEAKGLISTLDAINMKIEHTMASIREVTQGIGGLYDELKKQDVGESLVTELGFEDPEWAKKIRKKFGNLWETLGIKKQKIDLFEIDTTTIEKQYKEIQDKVSKGLGSFTNEIKDHRRRMAAELAKLIDNTNFNDKASVEALQQFIEQSRLARETIEYLDDTLKGVKGGERYKQQIEKAMELMPQFISQIDELDSKLRRMSDATKDNTIAAMADGMAKDLANIQRNREKALDEYGLLNKKETDMTEEELKLRNSIVARFSREEFNSRKSWGDKIYSVQKSIRDNILSAEKKGYALRIEQLRNAMDDEMRVASQNGILTGELQLSIKKKYDELMLQAQEEYYKNLEALEREQERRRKDYIQQQYEDVINYQQKLVDGLFESINTFGRGRTFNFDELFSSWKDNIKDLKIIDDIPLFSKDFLKELDIAFNKLDAYGRSIADRYQTVYKTLDEFKEEYENLFNVPKSWEEIYGGGSKIEKKFEDYLPILKYYEQEQQYINSAILLEQERLDIEKQLKETIVSEEQNRLTRQAGQQYEDRIRALEEQFNVEFLLRQKKTRELTEEEQRILDDYYRLAEEEEEQFNQRILTIKNNSYIKIMQLEKDYANQYTQLRKKSISEQIKAVSILTDYINEEVSLWGRTLTSFTKTNNLFIDTIFSTGTINLSKAKKDYNRITDDIKFALIGVNNEIERLKGETGDNRELIKALEETKKRLKKEAEDVKREWVNMVFNTIGQYKQMIDTTVSTISSFLSTMNETALTLIDNQLAVIEQELEIQQDAYDRAEEAANAHKDRMNDIEDELSEARGARREFLIDQLAQQEKAYLEDLAAQQRAAEAKEKLEKKQEALEKKRRQQEKKAQIQQAIINTYTAVSNALAVQPWFLGLALSAVALGLGMANVAAISNTPVYKDGGVIQGKRHSQGGVKVLGGQAEVEGGEYITNRTSTRMNLPLLEYINSKKKELDEVDLLKFFSQDKTKVRVNRSAHKFAQGGQIQKMNTQDIRKQVETIVVNQQEIHPVVEVVEIIDKINSVNRVRSMAGLPNA